ncbi:MAG: DNA primase [Candidatus Magasanikbacteria bacterium CG_4_10_14_0_8_um_filter_32_14]|uniref:DNA primase n=1 Tax=Candidatus Magasanikbacteria bacterium CG_4_10_14_0_8_um_filter_32_14 TaxID=1974640 RepID=A0A2M7RA18_9BACT|nr:MAG: DNA primase [Candidatus Magasanikbacteria bacterium CG_4_10_14_0_8_um_filter_32_14]
MNCSMSDINLIKNKIDVVDLIGEYIQLKPAGVNHKGLCPFHHEKSPSFMVNRERQSWHCFGCAKGGDIFSFVQEIEGMEFREALKYLADKAGVQLTNTFKNEAESSLKNRLKNINYDASHFFYNFLLKMESAKDARDYLQKRGLTQDTIDNWQIGFVLEQWDLLTQYLLKKGHSIDDLVASGLTIKRDNANIATKQGFYDRFRGRIMFPIWDVHDTVVGFTGRVLIETDKSGGKYVNTPQTALFDKSSVIFALNKAKKSIKEKDFVVVVEGQMDVIACHQVDMTNVVAFSGTAVTAELDLHKSDAEQQKKQIGLLKRYTNNMSMAFDVDEAGEKAARRTISLAMSAGMNVKIIQIPEGAGKDPDECIKKNKEVWFEVVKNASEVMNWYFSRAFINKDINNPKDKQHIASELLDKIQHIPFAVERDYWLKELGHSLGVDISVLRDDLVRIKSEEKIPVEKKNFDKNIETKTINLPESRLNELVKTFLVLFLRFYDFIKDTPDLFSIDLSLSTGKYNELYEMLKSRYNKGNKDISNFRDYFSHENQENIIDVLLMQGEKDFFGFKENEAKNEVKILSKRIYEEWLKEEKNRIQNELSLAESKGDTDKVDELMKRFQSLS